MAKDKRQMLLRQHSGVRPEEIKTGAPKQLTAEEQQSSDSEEYKTPTDRSFDSFEGEQSGSMSPVLT